MSEMRDLSQLIGDAKSRRRALLRVFNGVLLAAPLGALLGAALGALSAILLFQDWEFRTAYPGALFGTPPGFFAGILMGTTMIVRDPGLRWKVSVGMGVAVGTLYAVPAWGLGGPLIGGPVFLCGIIGGLLLSALLRWVRSQWPWWSRWENRG